MVEFVEKNWDYDKETVIIGDFNQDYLRITDNSYSENKVMEKWTELMDSRGLKQVIKSQTWSRIVKGKIKKRLALLI